MTGCSQLLGRADLVLFDGTFWTDDELIRLGIGERTARQMDHLPISGPDGSLARLAQLRGAGAGLHPHQQHQPHADRGLPERAEVEAGRASR